MIHRGPVQEPRARVHRSSGQWRRYLTTELRDLSPQASHLKAVHLRRSHDFADFRISRRSTIVAMCAVQILGYYMYAVRCAKGDKARVRSLWKAEGAERGSRAKRDDRQCGEFVQQLAREKEGIGTEYQ